MLPFIPFFIAITLTFGYISMMQESPSRPAVAEILSENMKLFHAAAVRQALRDDAAAGPLALDSVEPFSDMGGWRTSVLVDGGSAIVATWSSADGLPSADSMSSADADRIRAVMRLERDLRNWRRTSRAGRFVVDGEVERIGDIDVSGYDIPLLDGSPVLVTVIR
jgi:hypothetical protein